jgi:hypothetical protein
MIGGLAFVGNAHFGSAQSGTNVTGIIASDTSWTQANSPYNLIGNVLINSGTTVTIGTGTTLNLNGYFVMVNGSFIIQQGATINMENAAYILVNGLLSAIGTNANPISINGGIGFSEIAPLGYYSAIIFSQYSMGRNEQTSSGSIIENAIINMTSISVSSSVELANSTFLGQSLEISGGSPLITDNVIGNGISITGGSPIILNNAIHFSVTCGGSGEPGTENGSTTFIEDNVISGVPPQYPGISLGGYSLGNLIIERNLISTGIYTGNDGIENAMVENGTVSIINNTIINNAVGIYILTGYPGPISDNNIYDNTLNIKLGESNTIDCTNNWWGTTDQQAINQTIYDFKDDFTMGTVNFVPFLTTPNSEAMPNSNLPIPTPFPTSTQSPSASPKVSSASPSASPSQAEANTASSLPMELLVTGVAVIVIVAVAIGAFLLGKRAGSKKHP